MSRSTRKAIYKDKGHRKNDYWKVHRRVNKSILKHWIDGNRNVVTNDIQFEDYPEFDWVMMLHLENGATFYEAESEVYEDLEFDIYWGSIISDLFIQWWETPEFKHPKELVNDYNYCDYIIDEENNWITFCYKLDVEHREDRKHWIAKMRRK